MKDRVHSKEHAYEAVNSEDSDLSDMEEEEDEATMSRKGKFEQTQPLTVRLKKLRQRR